MKKTTLILLGFLLVITANALAQYGKANRNTIGISVGWQQLKFNDEHASPLLYKASSFPVIGLNYTHSSMRDYVNVKLSGGLGKADPERFGARDYFTKWSDKDSFQYRISSMFIHANVEATYLRKLAPASTGAYSYWMGGTLREQAYYADEVANFPWLINSAELSPAFRMDYQDNSRHCFSVKIDFAALALLSRSVFALFPKSNRDNNATAFLKQGTRLTSVHQYQKVNIELNYNYRLSRSMALGGTYGFKWMHYGYPKPLRAVDRRFTVNADYSLNKQ